MEDKKRALPTWIKDGGFEKLFMEDAIISVPMGWRTHVTHILALVGEIGDGNRIKVLRYMDNSLELLLESRTAMQKFYTSLLKSVEDICMKCGEPLTDDECGNRRTLSICKKCLEDHEPKKGM